MKIAKNSKEARELVKKAKEGDVIVWDERKEDNFEISYGNLKVLETIPQMMKEYVWRRKLRKLVLEYLTKEQK